ncbi:hypothetical protein Lbir_1616 [Legionella birminghamensis]|uniref:Uncharacterized protein n=1 Tax=Legionella birminghamensis TaxID=28083 RepID=A0A378ICA8_9GAMM|nr:hypothetical protein [Legionella birminghamensis]KTC71761.1 hypothetical protein Lbir_1616 [Legionella birminghamensis]STX32402.1 Uncharacterised protein [Legionella birminghamensis]
MTDIQSPQLAEKIKNLLDEAVQDAVLKKQLLENPYQFMKDRGIPIEGYHIVVQDNPGYPLFFALEPENGQPLAKGDPSTSMDSFHDLHFLDCHHY